MDSRSFPKSAVDLRPDHCRIVLVFRAYLCIIAATGRPFERSATPPETKSIQKKEQTEVNRIKNHRTAARLVLGAATAAKLLALPLTSDAAVYFYTDLNPSGFTQSAAYGISDNQQVGQGDGHALLWSGTASSVVDLHPNGFDASLAYGTSGSQQSGWGPSSATVWRNPHALLWSGTASSAVDLHPSGFALSYGARNSGSQQIGYGNLDDSLNPATGGPSHALLWSGTAASVVDLHPGGFTFTDSRALGISGGQQVGTGRGFGTGGNWRALLWSGTASSVVQLNPRGFTSSFGINISGSQQVGWGYGSATGNDPHALLWSGTARSAVDLNPSEFTWSFALGTSGSQQVGYGYPASLNNTPHAILWSGTASSVVDLHNFLSSDYSYSYGYAIDTNGNVVGYAHYIPTDKDHAILWTPVHERVVFGNDPGQCGAILTYATDRTNTTCSPASGSFFPAGSTTVTCTTTNLAGIPLDTFTFTVSVEDRELPQTQCPNMTVTTDAGQCSAQVNSFDATATDNCTVVAVVCNPPPGSVFPVGISSVNCTATDAAGNSNSCSFTVTVVDREAPLVACRPAPNPSGKKIPVAGKNPQRNQNPDGFYQLLAKDNCDPAPAIFVADSASTFVAGPFASGDFVKITQSPDEAPFQKPGPGDIVAHIGLQGDALLCAVDATGNVGAGTLCNAATPSPISRLQAPGHSGSHRRLAGGP